MDRVLNLVAFWEDKKYRTEVIWEDTYGNMSDIFWEETLNKIKMIDENPNNVRIVFWFDN
jgi:hypothetical protein